MRFSARQIHALKQDLKSEHIRTRLIRGRELSYIEGWHAIAEANRIFGFDGWNRETIESRCVAAKEIRGTASAVYIARIRVTIHVGSQIIVRDGHGCGEAQGDSIGEVHDIAYKAAETDATRRALATFGKPFGLGLYVTAQGSKIRQESERSKNIQIQPNETDGRHTSRIRGGDAGGARQVISVSSPAPASYPESRITYRRRTAQPQFDSKPQDRPAPVINAPISPANDDLPRRPVDKGLLAVAESRRKRDKLHLRFVASQPCLLCGRAPSDAHHLRFAQKPALGRKVSDEFTVPLCRGHHRQVHRSGNEAAWWEDMDIDPLPIAQGLWDQSHNLQHASADANSTNSDHTAASPSSGTNS